jgi:hypothetical protein
MTEILDLRCPIDSQRMFGRLVVDRSIRIVPGNLIEFACDKCKRRMGAKRVLHRFDLTGDLIETEVERGDEVAPFQPRVGSRTERMLLSPLEGPDAGRQPPVDERI